MSRAIFALGLLMVCAMRLSSNSAASGSIASDSKASDSKASDSKAVKPVHVLLHTELGDIEMEVNTDRAPVTSENFLRYVDRGFYDGAAFYRTVTPGNQPQNNVKIEVIQGGNPPRESEDLPPILLERTSKTGLKHVDGAISMARDQPDSATSEFFICIGDQPELDFGGKRNPDGQGFAAFGHVVKGMEVVRKIQASPANGQSLTPPIKILSAKRL
jgi:peptidyl-prolyl cis-trans isomerase A (cyclophilin A)